MATPASGPTNELAAILERRKKKTDVVVNAPPKPKGAGGELAARLEKRASLAEPIEADLMVRANLEREASRRSSTAFNAGAEFSEFTRKEVSDYTNAFKAFDADHSGSLNMEELKKLMEKLGCPQTHTALLGMMREADEDRDGELNIREFFMIFKKAKAGTLTNSGLLDISNNVSEVDVSEVGVKGAKSFFESKITAVTASVNAEEEIRQEQAQKQLAKLEVKERKNNFKERLNFFNTQAPASATETPSAPQTIRRISGA